jgi:hypothetical protein
MGCNHGSEFQIKVIHADGTEELRGWMKSETEVARAVASAKSGQGKTYWLRKRDVVCPDCLDKEPQIVLEFPILDTPSPRCRAHDSGYLNAVGSRDRYALISSRLS